jgi:hypothetical protein
VTETPAPARSWTDGPYVYVTVGVLADRLVADGRIEVPRDAPGAEPLLRLERVRAEAVRRDERGWRPTATRLVALSTGATGFPGARLGATLAASLGVANGDVVRLRVPARRELLRARSTQFAEAAASGVAALGVIVAEALQVTGNGDARGATVTALAVAFVASVSLSGILFRRALRNDA